MPANFETLFELTPDLCLILNTDFPHFSIATVSNAYLDLVKRNRTDIIGKSLFDIFPARDELKASLNRVMNLRKADTVHIQHLAEPDSCFWNITNTPVFGPSDEIVNVIHRVENTDTQIKKRMAELLQSEKQLKFITDNLPVAITYLDREERFKFCNETYAKWRGMAKEEIIGKCVRDFLDDETYEIGKKIMEKTFSGKEHVSEMSIKYAGKTKLIKTLNYPDFDSEGNVIGFMSVTSDITQQKEIENILLQAKKAAESANQAKSEFLANMSHEIRTPLGAVLGFADLIANTEVTPAEKIAFTDAIKRNGELLTNIISDILDLSKVEVGKLNVDIQETSLVDILNDVETLLGLNAAEKGIKFRISFSGSIPKIIKTDPHRLRQVLLNVVGNAIKFTEKGFVQLTLQVSSDEKGRSLLSFVVKDSGRGISAEQVTRLFKPFSQADSSIVNKFGGTGLGLGACVVSPFNSSTWRRLSSNGKRVG